MSTPSDLDELKKEQSKRGNGAVQLANGDSFEGDMLDSRPHGTGVYMWKDGSTYSGDWLGGMKHGRGRYMYGNGDLYEV